MPESINKNWLVPFQPSELPGLVSFWRFDTSGEQFVAQQGEPYCLQSHSGALQVDVDPAAPLGGRALRLDEGQWLSTPRDACPGLDFHGPQGHFTLVAWIKRDATAKDHCEFIAGQWNETHLSRQYGLFINIKVWLLGDRLCGHLSQTGGPTPGYKYCMDGSMGATEIPCGAWSTVAMSYDGQNGYAWLNGLLDARTGLNPYPMPGGLHDGGPKGSDFTVGAVDRSGQIGNFFCGHLAGLAVYRRALSPAEIFALAQQ